MTTPLMKKPIKIKKIQAFALAFLFGLIICPASQADQATLGIRLRILPHLNATLVHAPSNAIHNTPSSLPIMPSLKENQLCITHTQQILYSIETQASFTQREPKPSNSSPKPIGYDFILALQTRSSIESPDEINDSKVSLSHIKNKIACTKISTLMGNINALSDANNSFADDGTPQVITVTINTE